MKPKARSRIPIPRVERWRRARMTVLPSAVLVVTLAILAVLWRDHVASPTKMGQVEAVAANASSPPPGFQLGLNAQSIIPVGAGDLPGHAITADASFLEAPLEVIRSELEILHSHQDHLSRGNATR